MTSLRNLSFGSGARHIKAARPSKIFRSTALLLFTLWATHSFAAPQEECVGRYRLALPSEADVAMSTAKSLTGPDDEPIRFPDNLNSPLSIFAFDGAFKISRSLSPGAADALMQHAKDAVVRSAGKPYEYQRFKLLSVEDANSVAWKSPDKSGFYTFKDGTTVSFIADLIPEQKTLEILGSLRVRGDGEVPSMPGVCLPGLFIERDGPDALRNVGVTFRLKEHPDVLIFFHDLKVLKDQPRLTSRQKNEFVWTSEFGVGKTVKLHGVFPWRTVKLDDREGVGSFATITRRDNSTDYGYLVTVQGDLDAAADTPD
jgi:hypothetical protein